MAMQFRKPKRNLRVRDSVGLQDNENEEKMDVDTVLKMPKPLKEKTIKKVNTLSFGDELNECEYFLNLLLNIINHGVIIVFLKVMMVKNSKLKNHHIVKK